MRHNIPAFLIRLSILAVALWCVVLTASAQTTAFSYQGQLNDGGSPANGSYDIQFKLFDSLTAGAQIGPTIPLTNVAVSSGIFTVTLDFGASSFPGANRWLEISMRLAGSGSFITLTPRQQLTSAPYAIKSLNAATSDGLSAACTGCVSSSQIGSLPTGSDNYIQNTTTQQASSNFNISGNGLIGGNVGIGMTMPKTKLDTAGTIRSTAQTVPTSGEGLEVIYSDGQGYLVAYDRTAGLYKHLNLNGSVLSLNADTNNLGAKVGVGTTDPSSKLTVIANFPGEFSPPAIYAENTFGIGVQGRGNSVGVLGTTDSLTGFGDDSNSGFTTALINPIGVKGQSDAGTGIYGSTVSGTGVWGISTTGLAGKFTGNVSVTGNLSKGGGSFKIDHPLDPENKYLYHSFVESPDMMNIYNGNITTNAEGEATVTMPDYFEALNRDFRYQLTVIEQFAQAIVARKINGNSFTIKTDKPNVEVSWQVTGVRQDAYANKHRIQVEEAKPERERGSYLHPEVFGQPEEKGVEWARQPEMMRKTKEQREKLQQAHEQTEKPTLRQE